MLSLTETELTAPDAIEAGRAALQRGAWAEAFARFTAALELEESVRAYEGLGVAARYRRDIEAAVAAHERGYRLARARGDDGAAAKLASQLAIDAYGRGRVAEAGGWVERALQITERAGPSEGRALALVLQAHVAMQVRNDPLAAQELSERALEVALAAGSGDVELFASALQGLALVSVGSVEEGMRRLDAATAAAVAGEVEDVDMAETICCYLIDACKRVRDLDRVAEWCERVAEIAGRYDDRFMFAVCRIHHADVLIWRGGWTRAEEELETAARALQELRMPKIDTVVRIAELRRRQRRLAEAAELLAGCDDHYLHPLHLGRLQLDRGNPAASLEAAERFLRRIGDTDRFARIAGLELLVHAAVQAGLLEAASEGAAEIRSTADAVETGALRATALLAEGRVAAARADWQRAQACLEDAAAGLEAAGAWFDAAQAWTELAALAQTRDLQAPAEAARERAERALARVGLTPPARRGDGTTLSRREREVLRLLARGHSNAEIAGDLFLSVRTVERHVANVYAKLALSGRTARAAATAWAHAHGIT